MAQRMHRRMVKMDGVPGHKLFHPVSRVDDHEPKRGISKQVIGRKFQKHVGDLTRPITPADGSNSVPQQRNGNEFHRL